MMKLRYFNLGIYVILSILFIGGCTKGNTLEVRGVNIIDVEPEYFNPNLYKCPYSVNIVSKVILSDNNYPDYTATCQIIINGKREEGLIGIGQYPNPRNIIQIDPDLEVNNIGICCKTSDISNKEVCDYYNLRCNKVE